MSYLADARSQTFRSTNLLPLSSDPNSISRSAIAFKALLDQPTISSLDEVIVTVMKCLFTLSQHLKKSDYVDSERTQQIVVYKQMAMNLVQFASGLRLRLGPDVYRQLSSMSELLSASVSHSGISGLVLIQRRCILLASAPPRSTALWEHG